MAGLFLRIARQKIGSQMRDLLFKNLVSHDHKRKVIASSETMDKEGVRSVIRRHFICMIREINNIDDIQRPLPQLHVIKEHNEREHKERFFCKIKGSLCVMHESKTFLVVFMHSLRIDLIPSPQQLV